MATKGNGTRVWLVVHEKYHDDVLIYACFDYQAAADKVMELANTDLLPLVEDDELRRDILKHIEDDDAVEIESRWHEWTQYEETLEVVERELLVVEPTTLDLMEQSRS